MCLCLKDRNKPKNKNKQKQTKKPDKNLLKTKKTKTEFFKLLVILRSESPIISNECFYKDMKFCKSSKCLDNEALLRWRVARDEFLFILSLLKSLMSWYLESIETG